MYSEEEEYSSDGSGSELEEGNLSHSSSSSSDVVSSDDEDLSSEAEHPQEEEEEEDEQQQTVTDTEKRPAGKRQIKRQLEYYNVLPTWGTESAEEYNISPQQLLDLVFDIEDKVSLYRLSTVLADPEIASCFIAMEGVPALMTCFTTLTGNSLAYAVNALLSFVRHDFAIDELTAEIRHLTEGSGSGEARIHKHPITKKPVYCREQLLELISSTQEGAENARALHLGLEVMTHICSRSMDAFAFLHSSAMEKPNEDKLQDFYRSITAPLEHLGLDVQLACLRLVNSVVSCAHDPDEYDEIVGHLTQISGFTEKLGTLKDESSNVALLREISRFETQTAEGFGHKNVLLMMKSDVQQLQKQLQDVSSVATEYMTQNKKLQAELSAFRRREPLVQLLWKEITHCRKALHRAIEAGFSFDLGAPDRRWAPPAGMADIGQLWVLEKQFGGGLAKGGVGVEGLDDLSSDSEEDTEEELNFMRLGSAPTTAEILEQEIVRSTSTEELVNLAGEKVEPTLTLGGGGNLALGPPTDANTGILAPPSAGGIMAPPSKVHLGAGGMLAPPPNLLRVPQPSKPVIKPPVKMKPLHWRRIIVEDKAVESVWNEIGDNFDERHLKLDTAVTVKYFEDKKRKKRPEIEGDDEGKKEGRRGREGSGTGKGTSRIVDDKTFQTLSILLRSLPAIPETVRAIKQMDSTMLSAGQVTRILKSLPDQEMMRKVETAPEMDSELSLPDLYVRELSRIPQISARLDCWSFVLNFEERLSDTRGPVKALLEAFEAVRKSSALRKALGTVLTVGNFLNGNTTRGQADGFQLEVLRRLKMFKDSEDGDLTLLQYISDLLLDRFGQDFADQLWKELEPAYYAQEHNMDQVIADVSSFTQAVNTKKKLASLVISASPDSDRFASTVNRFYGKAEKKLSKLRTEALDARRAFEDIKIWMDPFGRENELKQIKTTDFFPNLVEFAESVKACAQRRQREKEEAEERRRMMERQEAARKERERRLAAAGETGEKGQKGLKIKLRAAAGHGPQPQLNIAELRSQLRKRGNRTEREDVKEAEWEDGDEEAPKKEKKEEKETTEESKGDKEDKKKSSKKDQKKKSGKEEKTKKKKSSKKKRKKDDKKVGRKAVKERRAKSDNDKSSGDSSSETDSDANLEPDAASLDGMKRSTSTPSLVRAKTSVEDLSSKKKKKKRDKKSKKEKKEKKKDKEKKKKRSKKEKKAKKEQKKQDGSQEQPDDEAGKE